MGTRRALRSRIAVAIFLPAVLVACGDGDEGSVDPGRSAEPGPAPEADTEPDVEPGPESGPQGDVVLREIGSCGDAAGSLGDYLSGFELYDSEVVAGDDRYSCEWRLPADTAGWAMAVILVGHYTNTPDYGSDDWSAAGFTQIDDARVEPFDGLVLLTEPGSSRAVHVLGPRFDARLQVVGLQGREPDHIPVEDAVGILLALTES